MRKGIILTILTAMSVAAYAQTDRVATLQGARTLVVTDIDETRLARARRLFLKETAAETGVLLLSTLHTSSAANTINRILDVFPANQQKQVKIQLAQILKGVVCQQLVNSVEGGQMAVFEVMKTTTAIQNMIREDKLHQLESAMQAGAADGMCTMDGSLLKLYKEGKITRDTALLSCVNYENMVKRLGM